jgi:molybdopterin molybdotransferase
MIDVDEARRLVQECVVPVTGVEQCPLEMLAGRVLAGDVVAPFGLPRFTNSAMDGFAVRWVDVQGCTPECPVMLRVTDDIPAGSSSLGLLMEGTTARIMTGAPLPEGADTVVPFEFTSGFAGDEVTVFRLPSKNGNVRYAGEEVRAEERVLVNGSVVSTSEIAVLASLGYDSSPVRLLPSLSIVVVGDELQSPGDGVSEAEIYDSNSFMLQSACRSIGIEPCRVRHAVDDRVAVSSALAAALREADLVVTVGGISTGEYDFVREELERLGVNQQFWTVAQKPGKPVYFGTRDGRAVFALPGNPVSALVCFAEYVVPAIMLMQGRDEPHKMHAVLDSPFPADRKRHRFLPGRLRVEGGRLVCSVTEKIESHMISSLVGSNCIIECPPSLEPIPAGSAVLCSLLPWAGLE